MQIITIPLLLILLTSWAAASPRIVPMMDASLSGGKTIFDGSDTGFQGNAQVNLLPVVELNDRVAFLPSLRGAYVGHQTAVRVVDEQTLFQQTQDYQGELGWLYRFAPNWKLVVAGGGTWTFLRETQDENWGAGLYNHQSQYGNISIEHAWPQAHRPLVLRAGVESARTVFPNYESLSSQSGVSTPGRNTLDAATHQIFLESEISLSSALFFQGRVLYLLDHYEDQKVVTDSPEGFSDENREDHLGRLGGRFDWMLSPGRTINTTLSLDLRAQWRRSNQNEKDVAFNTYLDNYYDYDEGTVGPSVAFRMARSGLELTLGVDGQMRRYTDRPAQSEAGTYEDSRLVTFLTSAYARVSAPMGHGFRVFVLMDRVWADANTDYTGTYSYRYDSISAQVGISYVY